ncbi:MAG: response regulator [Thermodesulfobacteriota bacterium]|nr:response regulator [Thermodesulfobacteriota bacterium]
MSEPKKILLVDDDKAFVESNTDLLEAYDYKIFVAYDGAGGFETAMREHPDLMVLDVMMAHETEGFEIAQKIRKIPELKDMKILLVSGITKVTDFPRKLEPNSAWLPVDRVMEKPIDPARFIAEVEKLLEEK